MSASGITLRPKVGMHQMSAIPHVCALGAVEGHSGWAIGWPHAVVDGESGAVVLDIHARAGYDEDGMYCAVTLGQADPDGVLEARLRGAVDVWATSLAGKPRLAPLAPVLSRYADALYHFGEQVTITYPNGRPYQTGTFSGVNVWGRATVSTSDGEDIEFAPERYRISW